EHHVQRRQKVAETLTRGVADLQGLRPPTVRDGCRHVYYVWALRYDEGVVGISRDAFSAALKAEGFPHEVGYVRPLYLLPLFQRRVAFGRDGYPLSLSNREYGKGLCPISERMHEKELIVFETCAYDLNDERTELLVAALRKVYNARKRLASRTAAA
ncbi:MAG: DegT/DnrJ/EryC1/StrS family aminotransferase, partial [Acidobacteria bacterium]|nr:DegT/DnrJ/EryC1/StrS family aminotransferase [Acidobacteriota bacterium]